MNSYEINDAWNNKWNQNKNITHEEDTDIDENGDVQNENIDVKNENIDKNKKLNLQKIKFFDILKIYIVEYFYFNTIIIFLLSIYIFISKK